MGLLRVSTDTDATAVVPVSAAPDGSSPADRSPSLCPTGRDPPEFRFLAETANQGGAT